MGSLISFIITFIINLALHAGYQAAPPNEPINIIHYDTITFDTAIVSFFVWVLGFPWWVPSAAALVVWGKIYYAAVKN